MLLFASYRDLAGGAEFEVDVPVHSTARDAVLCLRGLRAGLDRIPVAPAVAVNLEYVSLDTSLNEGDEVALIPPVAGG